MASPVTFENTVRIHDTAVMNWLSGLHVDYGAGNPLLEYAAAKNDVSIIAVMASPDRAAAKIWQQLVVMGWLTEAEALTLTPKGVRLEQIPLPAVSVMRGDPAPDNDLRMGPAKRLRSPDDLLNPDTDAPYSYQYPGHYMTPYTLSFWCSKRYTEAFVREWLMGQLGPTGCRDDELLIPVVHNAPFGTVYQSFRQTGINDRSDLEGNSPRYLRVDVSFVLRVWAIKAPVA